MLIRNLFLQPPMVGLALLLACLHMANGMEQAAVGELFSYKIEPLLFNWTHQVISEQFRYRVSLEGYADLPSWLRYKYSHEYHSGFLYGTPTDRLADKTVRLDIVALNKQNYETRTAKLSIFVAQKLPSLNIIQMKIDNLNWVHLMDPGRVENLRNIFRKDLWPESENDLSVVFMESAVNMGGRLPLRPQQREGVVVHLGSSAQFSSRLKELQEEVRPLYKLTTCTYKRTSVQKVFENAGFKLDWCAFKTVGADISPEILFHNYGHRSHHENFKRTDRWVGIAREDVPDRNYIDEFAFAFAIPGMILAVLLGILSAALCFQHEKLFDPNSDFFFENIFHICEESCKKENDCDSAETGSEMSSTYHPTTSTVQMVQCSDSNTDQPVTTLKSLKDPNCLLDNVSMHSHSPNNSYYQTDSPSNTYLRPKPPPYKGGTLNRNGVDI
ncbi:epsilon-sarcoglycan isoform X1 [Anastrepha ludens]|uniref:epsilon-sarcoglycan isoform X1 n=1 Tax=Anastrepha ludens TaxID=28586 RepID=UPI0023B0CCCB|nr:epsilon-sarcoglycan isoform X1 [Anastrepha ludens]